MSRAQNYSLPVLLVTSSLLLSSLVPGGPVEHRDFSQLDPAVLLGFNSFLTLLGLGSLVLAYRIWRGSRLAFLGAAAAGGAYFLVYALDLAGLFPQSPTSMGSLLMLVELVGLVLALPLAICGYASYRRLQMLNEPAPAMRISPIAWLGGGLTAVAIILFSTCAALSSAV